MSNCIWMTTNRSNDRRRQDSRVPVDSCRWGFALRALSFIVLTALPLLWCGCASPHKADLHPAASHLAGKVSGNSYTSPQGHFTVPFPVSHEVGGRIIHDDAQSVTFYDNWGSKISFYSRPFNEQSPLVTPPQSEARGKALETFMKDIYGDLIVAHYHPDALDGAVSFVYLKPVSPKTGVATFISHQRVYLVETDYLPGMQLLSNNDDASEVARDQWLEKRAVDLLQSVEVK